MPESSNAFYESALHSERRQPRPTLVVPAKPDQESDSPFAVSVSDVYEGPLDLLLDLIRKQDIDIYDIPIARITAQYLDYVEKIRELDVNKYCAVMRDRKSTRLNSSHANISYAVFCLKK